MITLSDILFFLLVLVGELLHDVANAVIVAIVLLLTPIIIIAVILPFAILCLLDTSKTADHY